MHCYVSSNFIPPQEDRAIAPVNPMNLYCFTKSISILSSLCLNSISQQLADSLFIFLHLYSKQTLLSVSSQTSKCDCSTNPLALELYPDIVRGQVFEF